MSPRGPGGPRGGRGPKPEHALQTLARLLSYVFSSYRLRLLTVAVCIVVSALVSVAGSLFLEVLIDDYITPLLYSENPAFAGLLQAILVMAFIYACGITASFIQNRFMVTISQGTQKLIRDDLFAKMQRLPLRYFDSHSHGDLMSRFTNDIDTLRQLISQSLPQFVSSLITILFVFVSMLRISWPLTGCVLLFSFVMVRIAGMVSGRSSRYFAKQQSNLGALNGYIEEMIHGQKVVKVFCYEEEAKRRFDRLNEELCASAGSANRYANSMGPLMGNLGHLQYIFLAIIGGAMAISGWGSLTLGGIASFLQLSRSFSMPINQISQQFSSVVMALAGAERIFALMDEEPEVDEGEVTLVRVEHEPDGSFREVETHTGAWAWKQVQDDGSFCYVALKGEMQLIDVDFSYDSSKQVLHDIDITARPGQKVALVGATGAGKTTITNLINRFYDIQQGQILYDGIDIKEIRKSDLRRSLGVILQDTHLFTGTVMENIRYGHLDASDEEVYQAARLAHADNFIRRLPDGYDTMLSGSDAELSQGQRQLLAIARAAIADPPVMIMDEATSSIDTRTESMVQAGMDSLMQGRTVFVIAHRLSTVHNADVILVLEQGEVIERGDHDSLIAKEGKYYQLYTGSFSEIAATN